MNTEGKVIVLHKRVTYISHVLLQINDNFVLIIIMIINVLIKLLQINDNFVIKALAQNGVLKSSPCVM